MKTTIISKGSMVRCYKCGSSQVSSICHHCGRPMCSRHGPVKPLLSWFTENREFKNLSLDKWPFRGDDGVHCEFHVHSTLNFRRIMIYPGLIVAIIGLVLLILAILSTIMCLTHWPTNVVISAAYLSEILKRPGHLRWLGRKCLLHASGTEQCPGSLTGSYCPQFWNRGGRCRKAAEQGECRSRCVAIGH